MKIANFYNEIKEFVLAEFNPNNESGHERFLVSVLEDIQSLLSVYVAAGIEMENIHFNTNFGHPMYNDVILLFETLDNEKYHHCIHKIKRVLLTTKGQYEYSSERIFDPISSMIQAKTELLKKKSDKKAVEIIKNREKKVWVGEEVVYNFDIEKLNGCL